MMEKVSRVREVLKGSKRKGGFTLVELLVVISIAAIILLIAVSQYGSFKGAKEKAKAEQIVNILRQVAEATYIYYMNEGGKPNNLSDLVSKGILKSEPKIDINGDGNDDTIQIVEGDFDGQGGNDLYIEVSADPGDNICDKIKDLVSSGIKCGSQDNITGIQWLVVANI